MIKLKIYFSILLFLIIGFASQAQKDSAQEVYEVAEQLPEYTGGNDAFRNFLAKNINYPDYAVENGIQGTVYLEAVVSKDGTLQNIQAIRGNDTLAAEAIRVLKQSGKWMPGKINGVPVNAKIRIPVVFKLYDGDDEKPKKKRKKSSDN